MSSNDVCLVLMLKAPERSKRRLAAAIGAPLATELAERLAACALEDLAGWPGRACLAPAEEGDLEWIGRTRTRGFDFVVQQRRGNLGARIGTVDAELRRLGIGRSLFIGIDCPELDDAYLLRAAACLAAHDVVLGPAKDGGVVLMGAARGWPDLESLPWSTPALHSALEAACAGAGLGVATLDARADIDAMTDLTGLERRLEHDDRPARQALRRWLAANVATRDDR